MYHQDAIQHLFRVVSGMDSMILGENEITTQIKKTYDHHKKKGTTKKMLNVLFQRSLYVSKMIKTYTKTSKKSISLGAITLSLMESIFDNLQQCKVVLIGAGEVASLINIHLKYMKIHSVVILNRTYEKTLPLIKNSNFISSDLSNLYKKILPADIIISSISSDIIIDVMLIKKILKRRKNRPLFLIDLSVPRTLDPAIHSLDNVFLYNLEDLVTLSECNKNIHHDAIKRASKVISYKSEELFGWYLSSINGKEKSLKHTSKFLVSLFNPNELK